jgi:predicted nuclease of predicted toxin-antitoxin system
MKGFLFDENLPINIQFSPTWPVEHVTDLGDSLSDTEIWEYAKTNDLVIVTKDADFSDRIITSSPPPRVIHLRFGNMRKRDFHAFLSRVWPKIETLIETHKLVNVYLNSLESVE